MKYLKYSLEIVGVGILITTLYITTKTYRDQRNFNFNSLKPWIKCRNHSPKIKILPDKLITWYRCKNLGKTPAENFKRGTFMIHESILSENRKLKKQYVTNGPYSTIYPNEPQRARGNNDEIIGYSKPYKKEGIIKQIEDENIYSIIQIEYKNYRDEIKSHIFVFEPKNPTEIPEGCKVEWIFICEADNYPVYIP